MQLPVNVIPKVQLIVELVAYILCIFTNKLFVSMWRPNVLAAITYILKHEQIVLSVLVSHRPCNYILSGNELSPLSSECSASTHLLMMGEAVSSWTGVMCWHLPSSQGWFWLSAQILEEWMSTHKLYKCGVMNMSMELASHSLSDIRGNILWVSFHKV